MTLDEYLNKPDVSEWWASITAASIGEDTTIDGLSCTPVYKDRDSVVVFPGGPGRASSIDVPFLGKLEHLALGKVPGTENMTAAETVIGYLHESAREVLKFRERLASPSIQQTLKERGERYGTFAQNGALYHALKTLLTTEKASPVQQMCLDMIAMKLSRMINGDINYRDNWVDIIGYCKGALGEGDE